MKKIAVLASVLAIGLCLAGCDVNVEGGLQTKLPILTYSGAVSGVFSVGDSVQIPAATADTGDEVSVEVFAPDGTKAEAGGGEFTVEQTGVYSIRYTAGATVETTSVCVMRKDEIDNCDDAGKIGIWSTADGEGRMKVTLNTDPYYILEGKGSYKIALDKSSGSWPAMQINATDLLSSDFTEYDELSFSIYNATEGKQKIFLKLWSDDGIQQVVESQLNAYGIEAGEWTSFSISFRELALYNPDFAVTDIIRIRIGIVNGDASDKVFYIDDISLKKRNPETEDFSGLQENEILLTGFENRADAYKNEPYSNGITRYATYSELKAAYPGIERTDSGKGLMYIKKDKGSALWMTTLESVLRPNAKPLMHMYNPDFSGYTQLKLDVFNPTSSTQTFYMAVASEANFGWKTRTEGVEVAPGEWGTITLTLVNAESADDIGEDKKGAVELQYIAQIDITANPQYVAEFYVDNLRAVKK